ncbi:MAG: hypothetical protein ACR2PH_09915, partial [Desulfobulbia bacterium]
MFLSVSFDLAGSTSLKRSMFQAGGNDFLVINRHYDSYVKSMFEIEEAFYRSVCASGIIDIRKLFLVKIIGDEYWYAYELDNENAEEVCSIADAFISSILEVLSEARSLIFAKDSDNDFHFDLSLKALIDLVTNALNLPDKRYAYFENKIMDLLGSEARLSQIDPDDYAALCYGLNFRPAQPISKELLGVTRSDYVGMQIDRYFRIQKACKPRLLTIGSSIWDRLQIPMKKLQPNAGVYQVLESGSPTAKYGGQCLASAEMIAAHEMTGINQDYNVWHLYSKNTL